jgi:hypothetical protein
VSVYDEHLTSTMLMCSRDFSRYDEQDDTIVAVGLVKAKQGELLSINTFDLTVADYQTCS